MAKLKIIFMIGSILLTLTACGGGSSSSGGTEARMEPFVTCVNSSGSVLTNNCGFDTTVRYFTSDPAAGSPTEAIVNLPAGGTLNVGPFAGERIAGFAACRAPLQATQIFQATRITCVEPGS